MLKALFIHHRTVSHEVQNFLASLIPWTHPSFVQYRPSAVSPSDCASTFALKSAHHRLGGRLSRWYHSSLFSPLRHTFAGSLFHFPYGSSGVFDADAHDLKRINDTKNEPYGAIFFFFLKRRVPILTETVPPDT